MQSLRSNITRLKNQIEGAFPDEGDLFEFPGVTRAGLIELMESASAESYQLLDKEAEFEIVLLKRKLAGPLETCREYLSEFRGGKKEKKHFDDFVQALTDIRDQIRLAYLICNKSGIRTEDKIQTATEELLQLVEKKDRLQSQTEDLLSTTEELRERLDSVATADTEGQSYLENLETASSSADELRAKIAASFELISKYEKQITDAHVAANESAAEITALVGRGDKATESLKSTQENLRIITQNTEQLQERCDTLADDITKTLAAANRVGMAGSFHSRKKELRTSLIIWGTCFVASILAIFAVGMVLIYPNIGNAEVVIRVEDIARKILVVAPLVWLAWMSARQYGYLSRIREDYSFKYATAMAFEGYKKHAQEINEELLEKLMVQSMEAAGQNPIRLYSSKDNHASPVQEALDKTVDALKAVFTNKPSD